MKDQQTEEIIRNIQHRLSQLKSLDENESETECDEPAPDLSFSEKDTISTTIVRKSTRKRFTPLRFWRNEHLVYDWTGDIVDVVRVPEVIKNTQITNKIKKMRKVGGKQHINKSTASWKSKYESLQFDYEILLLIQKQNQENDIYCLNSRKNTEYSSENIDNCTPDIFIVNDIEIC